jgi:hypothetical protein
LITAIFSQIVIAQENNLTIDMKPVTDSNINWETTLILDAQNGMSNGVLIELPSGLKMVPLSARINQTEMLLQNTNEVPSIESVISWDLSSEGVILLFQDGQFNTGDRIEVKTMTTQIKRTAGEDIVVNFRSAEKNDSTIKYSEEVKSSANLLLKIEDKR